MASNVSLFAQIIQLIPRDLFAGVVARHGADKHAKGCCSYTQLIALLYAQIGRADSLRDIEGGLRAVGGKLSHVGIPKAPSKSAIAYQNQRRPWQLFADFYHILHQHLLGQHTRMEPGAQALYALDSTTVPLCLALYPWAKFRAAKGGIKLHTLLNLQDCLPAYLVLGPAKDHDASKMEAIPGAIALPPGSVIVADRGYLSAAKMQQWHDQGLGFVIRGRENLGLELHQRAAPEGGHTSHVVADYDARLSGTAARAAYTGPLRMVQVEDQEGHYLELLTNQTGDQSSWTAAQVAALYKQRWQIEIFFKQLKQHLSIKSFLGTSENAVLAQVWTAMIALLLIKYLKTKAKVKWNFSNLIAFMRLNLFVKIDLWLWLKKPYQNHDTAPPPINPQLNLGFG